MNTSHKHHYLPQHYLQGFVNDSGSLFVYDKQKDTIFESGPVGVFFENNLNTVNLADGETSDFLEDSYTNFEAVAWAPFNRIRQSNYQTPVTLSDKIHLFYFLLFLYWRLPANTAEARRLTQMAFEETGDLDYFRLVTKDGNKAQLPKELIDIWRQSPAFQKAFRQILPYAPFHKDKDWVQMLDQWNFYYTADGTGWYVVGDNPIIARRNQVTDVTHPLEEFVFPISSSIMLISTKPTPPQDLQSIFITQYGLAMIENSQRFVAGKDKEYLNNLVKIHHDFCMKFSKAEREAFDLFAMLVEGK
jgi:hypothetical protein